MDAGFIVQSIVSVTAAVGVGQLLSALVGRRKTSAEAEAKSAEAGTSQATAAQIIADSATKMLGPLEKRIKDQDERLDQQDAEIRQLRHEQREHAELLVQHAAWDRTAIVADIEHRLALGPPPPLFPPVSPQPAT